MLSHLLQRPRSALFGVRSMASFRETLFTDYYVRQNVFGADEIDAVVETLKTPLPACFRVSPNYATAANIEQALKTEFQFPAGSVTFKDTLVAPPQKLPWFPASNGAAWQLECGRTALTKLAKEHDVFSALHQFLQLHVGSGAITRQEAVSMIPTLLLDVQPHHRVLDMCAAPGSKTSQIVETLAQDTTGTGFVVANDASEKRAYMLVHQTMRIGMMAAVVSCHQGQAFPGLYNAAGTLETTNVFDRVLCDVPCTGDGTLRKNENIWRRWHVGDALTLHPIQLEIGLRAAALLKVGGRMVYSTCSFNPIENEAIVAELLRRSDGALSLVDCSNELAGLKRREGLEKWEVAWQSKSKKQRKAADVPLEWFSTFGEEIPDDLRGYRLTRSMFPPADAGYGLHKCMRFLPHDQNTGGFFVAVLQKNAELPGVHQKGLEAFEVSYERGPKCHRYVCKLCGKRGHYIQDCELSEKRKAAASAPIEEVAADTVANTVADTTNTFGDAFVPLPDEAWVAIRDTYGLTAGFDQARLFARSQGAATLSYVSPAVQTACLSGTDLNLVNTGVKVFVKNTTGTHKGFRPAQDGLELVVPHMTKRKVEVGWTDFNVLVAVTSSKHYTELDPALAARLQAFGVGPIVVVLQPATPTKDIVALSMWSGVASISKLVTSADLAILADHLAALDAAQFTP
ncbi:tRNA (cytosine-5-)-methyltransferase NSUN2-like protein [Achlya hypogyna]|uniref:tRNA (Cytosine-5-)-methyltransferase NSUN2-like protein n=1 Tax=Achlya hypogyna TaxID=1202772 RepID=A0A1V9ZUR6_ACHHY|nr:tRNA (cytosine-5-)-methyltransferase NSUN2-like protein [Achlya hypogyna]